MESTATSDTFFQNEWSIYLITFFILLALFFIQKYAYLIDRKLNLFAKSKTAWEGRPWPLLLAISLGAITLLYNVFSPNDMQQNPLEWGWPEWTLVISLAIGVGVLAYECFKHFGLKFGLIRLLIFGSLMIVFFYAGFLAGLIIVTVMAIGIIIYFLVRWRKILTIK